jgi:hypothetical protein
MTAAPNKKRLKVYIRPESEMRRTTPEWCKMSVEIYTSVELRVSVYGTSDPNNPERSGFILAFPEEADNKRTSVSLLGNIKTIMKRHTLQYGKPTPDRYTPALFDTLVPPCVPSELHELLNRDGNTVHLAHDRAEGLTFMILTFISTSRKPTEGGTRWLALMGNDVCIALAHAVADQYTHPSTSVKSEILHLANSFSGKCLVWILDRLTKQQQQQQQPTSSPFIAPVQARPPLLDVGDSSPSSIASAPTPSSYSGTSQVGF